MNQTSFNSLNGMPFAELEEDTLALVPNADINHNGVTFQEPNYTMWLGIEGGFLYVININEPFLSGQLLAGPQSNGSTKPL
jgi:hypothetical protein